MFTFAMSLMLFACLELQTKVSEKSDMTKSWAARLCASLVEKLFVSQELIMNIKPKCCGIWDKQKIHIQI